LVGDVEALAAEFTGAGAAGVDGGEGPTDCELFDAAWPPHAAEPTDIAKISAQAGDLLRAGAIGLASSERPRPLWSRPNRNDGAE